MRPRQRDGSQLALYEARTGRAMVVLSLAVIPLYVAQALAGDTTTWAARPLDIARLGIQITMGMDVAIRTYLAPRRGAFLANHKLDVLAIAVPPVRSARELFNLRSIFLRPGVARFGALTATLIVGCALVVYAAEHDQDGASIRSVGDAFWWAIVTTTTVGYGDEVPVTDQGRLMAVVLMMLGVAVLAVVTANIAAYFVDDERDRDAAELGDRLDGLEVTLKAIEAHLGQLALSRHAQPVSQPREEFP